MGPGRRCAAVRRPPGAARRARACPCWRSSTTKTTPSDGPRRRRPRRPLPRRRTAQRLASALRAVARWAARPRRRAWPPARLRPAPSRRSPAPRRAAHAARDGGAQLLAQGLANKAIAERLGISDHTAKFHVNAILGKLGAQTRTEAIVAGRPAGPRAALARASLLRSGRSRPIPPGDVRRGARPTWLHARSAEVGPMADAVEEFSEALAGVVERTAPAVVRVEGRRRGAASGVAWSEDVVVTAAPRAGMGRGRLSRPARRERPTGQSLSGAIRAPTSPPCACRAPGSAPPPGRTLDGLKVGHLVLAVSRPGRTAQARLGIVAALGGRWRTPSGGRVDRYLQTDIVAAPGLLRQRARGRGAAACAG